MTQFKVKANDPCVAPLCRILGYRRREVIINTCESVTLQNLNWDGGSKDYYHGWEIGTQNVARGDHLGTPHPMDNEREGTKVALRAGSAIVRTGVFMGKESMMMINVLPENVGSLLLK
jgi:hypothetical protein